MMKQSSPYANLGVARNKRPLRNIVYIFEVKQLKDMNNNEKYSKYKFEDGYLVFKWKYQNADFTNWSGFITLDEIRELIDSKQFTKFINGKREFIIQRRVNGKNIPVDNK